ncbi:MAG TPA: hypothetical protein VH092_14360 [Urbifossiella sp.]|jgi:type III restriction enzyme|nr:hypothetical protein [Urbifossiella sp.]
MPPVVIENPILNSPFDEPARHFRFDNDNRITAETLDRRRVHLTSLVVVGQSG